jgi:hypothetical protein
MIFIYLFIFCIREDDSYNFISDFIKKDVRNSYGFQWLKDLNSKEW